jgi:hypothetical protein
MIRSSPAPVANSQPLKGQLARDFRPIGGPILQLHRRRMNSMRRRLTLKHCGILP